MMSISIAAVATAVSIAIQQQGVEGFTFIFNQKRNTCASTKLNMGLFDGVKEAFTAPALERSTLDVERETPIDRWMGWNVKSEEEQSKQNVVDAPADFVDSMDATNYATVQLSKPMGIVFEENDEEFGGIFVLSVSEGGVAAVDGTVQPGDQLVAVANQKVSGLTFDEALGAIINNQAEMTKLTLFRGTASQFYGPTGPSQQWLDEFVSSA